METHRRGSDGRRYFTPQLIWQWQRLSANGRTAAVAANEEVVPASELRAAQQRIKELERGLGKIEILQAARAEVRRRVRFYRVSRR